MVLVIILLLHLKTNDYLRSGRLGGEWHLYVCTYVYFEDDPR